MENLSLYELRRLLFWYSQLGNPSPIDAKILQSIKQAIADKEFEEKTRPLNF